jgi:hypothetical protein
MFGIDILSLGWICCYPVFFLSRCYPSCLFNFTLPKIKIHPDIRRGLEDWSPVQNDDVQGQNCGFTGGEHPFNTHALYGKAAILCNVSCFVPGFLPGGEPNSAYQWLKEISDKTGTGSWDQRRRSAMAQDLRPGGDHRFQLIFSDEVKPLPYFL